MTLYTIQYSDHYRPQPGILDYHEPVPLQFSGIAAPHRSLNGSSWLEFIQWLRPDVAPINAVPAAETLEDIPGPSNRQGISDKTLSPAASSSNHWVRIFITRIGSPLHIHESSSLKQRQGKPFPSVLTNTYNTSDLTRKRASEVYIIDIGVLLLVCCLSKCACSCLAGSKGSKAPCMLDAMLKENITLLQASHYSLGRGTILKTSHIIFLCVGQQECCSRYVFCHPANWE